MPQKIHSPLASRHTMPPCLKHKSFPPFATREKYSGCPICNPIAAQSTPNLSHYLRCTERELGGVGVLLSCRQQLSLSANSQPCYKIPAIRQIYNCRIVHSSRLFISPDYLEPRSLAWNSPLVRYAENRLLKTFRTLLSLSDTYASCWF